MRKRRKREQTRSHFYTGPFNHCVDFVVVRVQWQGARLCCHRSNTGGTMTSCIAVLTTWSKKGETSQRTTTAEHHQIREEGQRRLKSLLLTAAKERGRNLNGASALFFAVICWGVSIGTGNTNSLKKPIGKASSVIGCKPDTMEAVMERRMLNKLLSILDNTDHPLHPDLLPSSRDPSQTDWFSFAARRTQLEMDVS